MANKKSETAPTADELGTNQAPPFNATQASAEAAPEGGEAFLIQEDPTINAPGDPETIEPVVEDQVPVAVDQAAGDLSGQVPVLTPGVLAPISTVALPNAHRDATALALQDGVIPDEDSGRESIRHPRSTDEARDARDLARLLNARPHWVNNLDQLDELERADGVENPAPWVADPQTLLEEAKRYNFRFIGANGNFLPGD